MSGKDIVRKIIEQISEKIETATINDLIATIPMLSKHQPLVTCKEENVDRGDGWVESMSTVKLEVVEAE